jgi:hypothetical protein
MVNLQSVVWVVLYLIIAGAVFGLLLWLTSYVERQFPGEGMALFAKVARILLVVLAVLLVIGVLVSMVSGTPLFYWGSPPVR